MEKIKIDQTKNEVLVKFNEHFYKKEFVNQATLDFKEICNVQQNKEGLLLKPKEKKHLEILGYEFYNYVLGLMKNQ